MRPLKKSLGNFRYAPFCFSEQGVTMLSCVLNSERAIAVNIQVIRIFHRMREMISTHKDILLKLEQLENKVSNHGEDIRLIFDYLKQLLSPVPGSRDMIGFKAHKGID